MSYTHFERQATRRYRSNTIVDILDATSYRSGAGLTAFAFNFIGSVLPYPTMQKPRQRATSPAPADTGISV